MLAHPGLYLRRRITNAAFIALSLGAALFGLVWLALILGALIVEGFSALTPHIFTLPTPPPMMKGGLSNAIVGSVIMSGLAMMVGTPIGLFAGTYLAEYGRHRRFSFYVRFVNDILLSAPSIVIGLFVYEVVVVPMGHFSAIAGAASLSVIVIPVVARTTEGVHLVNNLAMPVSLLNHKSYSAFSGVQDALVQWWYGHNAVGFFLTAGFLGMMYYFVPKQAERPVYSYRLSIVHFWALIAVYIWAGPHHLHYTALPDWAQSLGMVMSLILLAPSWGGMINGMMTLSGAWHKLRTDPILRFLVVSLAFYGMSTFEGPMMAIKTVNALSHYTDWTIGHVHAGALGWVAMVSIGSLYHMIPKVFGREQMHSVGLINAHFWLATIGTVLYIASMWVNGITQGLMWRAVNADGTLTYSFVEALAAGHPGFVVRMIGGAVFLSGMLIMAYNTWRTIASSKAEEAEAAARIPAVVGAH